MYKMLAAGALVAASLGAPSALLAQDTPMPPPAETPLPAQDVVQTQANPRGSDAPAVTYPAPATASTPVPPSLPVDPGYHAGPYKGALSPPPPEAFNKVYPLCTRKIQDSCRNPGGV